MSRAKRPNYRLKDGCKVILRSPASVDGYWHDPEYAPRGCWERLYVLRGTIGTVIRAMTPKVAARPEDCQYFANVDVEIPHLGTVRVRVDHSTIRRTKSEKP